MKIATFNVNSVNARLENLLPWLAKTQPDVVLLQEIKTEFNSFPFFEFQTAGYEAKILGQKSYNGVAVLSRHKIKVVAEGIPGFEDEHSRYLEAVVNVGGEDFRVASIYLPNGNPPYNDPDDTSKFTYKLRWMEALYNHTAELLHHREPVILGGDFNVIMTNHDVYDPELFRNNALFRPEVIQRLKAIEYQGWTDAFRALYPLPLNGYTYWDYAGGAFQNDLGLRIDYLWLSPKAADRLVSCEVDKNPRSGSKPSDHTALVAEIR